MDINNNLLNSNRRIMEQKNSEGQRGMQSCWTQNKTNQQSKQ